MCSNCWLFLFFKQKTAYEMRISDWSSDVCSSDLVIPAFRKRFPKVHVSLAEGNPQQLANMVLHEQADLAIATETLSMTAGLVTLPVYSWERSEERRVGKECFSTCRSRWSP